MAVIFLSSFKTNVILDIMLVLYILVSSTDYVDGWVARRMKITSDLGKVLDPLADKILVLVFLPLLSMQVITALPVFVILTREFAVMALRVVAAKNDTIVAAGTSGKIKTALTLPLCGLLLARIPVLELAVVPKILIPIDWARQLVVSIPQVFFDSYIWIVVLVTVWSFIDYFKGFMWQSYLKKYKNDSKKARLAAYAWIPNSMTFLNVICGFLAVYYVFADAIHLAVFYVFLGSLLDATDGKLARKLGVDSKLGKSLDSRADLITFGFAPGVILAGLFWEQFGWIISLITAILYTYSVYFRLVRFNEDGHGDMFIGLPCPIGAIAVLMFPFLPWFSNPYVAIIYSYVIMGLMVSRLPYLHMSAAMKQGPFRGLIVPSLMLFIGMMLNLLGISWTQVVPFSQLYYGFALVYLVSPIFNKRA